MTAQEYSNMIYERHYKGYYIVEKDVFTARELAKESAILNAEEMLLLSKEEPSLAYFYSNVLTHLKTI